MRIWLTGGSGFVGSNLIAEFRRAGDDVRAAVHRTPPGMATSMWQADLLDAGAVRADIVRYAPDVVVHVVLHLVQLARVEPKPVAFRALVEVDVENGEPAQNFLAPRTAFYARHRFLRGPIIRGRGPKPTRYFEPPLAAVVIACSHQANRRARAPTCSEPP